MRFANGLITGALAAALLVCSPARAAFDHLKCYRVRDTAPRARYTADLAPGGGPFTVEAGCTIRVPAKFLCTDVDKTNVTPAPPGAPAGPPANRFLCYKVRCPRGEVSLQATDQFGSRLVSARNVNSLVCAPIVPVPTTTMAPATTTTTATTPGSCGDGVCFFFFGEFCNTCPADCGPCGTCVLDGACDRAAGESCVECSADCGACSCTVDDTCDTAAGENCAVCAPDCNPCNACGDGFCAAGETCGSCPGDCCP
jgi:hypothetical protein